MWARLASNLSPHFSLLSAGVGGVRHHTQLNVFTSELLVGTSFVPQISTCLLIQTERQVTKQYWTSQSAPRVWWLNSLSTKRSKGSWENDCLPAWARKKKCLWACSTFMRSGWTGSLRRAQKPPQQANIKQPQDQKQSLHLTEETQNIF